MAVLRNLAVCYFCSRRGRSTAVCRSRHRLDDCRRSGVTQRYWRASRNTARRARLSAAGTGTFLAIRRIVPYQKGLGLADVLIPKRRIRGYKIAHQLLAFRIV